METRSRRDTEASKRNVPELSVYHILCQYDLPADSAHIVEVSGKGAADRRAQEGGCKDHEPFRLHERQRFAVALAWAHLSSLICDRIPGGVPMTGISLP